MGRDEGGGYDLTEIFAIKFVLADVLVVFAFLLAGWEVALAIVGLLLLSTFLIWHLSRTRGDETAEEADVTDSELDEVDPISTLQERYAAGELSESEFEAKLDELIDANERAERAGVETRDLELDRER